MKKKCIFGIYAYLITNNSSPVEQQNMNVFRGVRNFQKRLQNRHVCPSAWHSAPTGQITMKFDISGIFEKKYVEEKFKFDLKYDKHNEYFTRRSMYIYTYQNS
jgi:predicted component of type VI protein secretion system